MQTDGFGGTAPANAVPHAGVAPATQRQIAPIRGHSPGQHGLCHCCCTANDWLPRDLLLEAWESFSDYIFGGMNQVSTLCAVGLLLCVQFAQTLTCVPFLHITQILIGYYLCAGGGFLLSVTWEILLVTAFVMSQKGSPDGKSTLLLIYIAQCRERGRLYASLVCVMMLSIPINMGVCLVVFGDVTFTEFLATHYCVTCVMTLKNVLIGEAIHLQQHSPRTLRVCMAVMVFFAVLPSLFTLYLTSSVYYTASRCGDAECLVLSDLNTDNDPTDRADTLDTVTYSARDTKDMVPSPPADSPSDPNVVIEHSPAPERARARVARSHDTDTPQPHTLPPASPLTLSPAPSSTPCLTQTHTPSSILSHQSTRTHSPSLSLSLSPKFL